MKAIVEPLGDDNFKPYTVTITIETKEESTHFHDNVMGKIPVKQLASSGLFADIFCAGKGEFNDNNEVNL